MQNPARNCAERRRRRRASPSGAVRTRARDPSRGRTACAGGAGDADVSNERISGAPVRHTVSDACSIPGSISDVGELGAVASGRAFAVVGDEAFSREPGGGLGAGPRRPRAARRRRAGVAAGSHHRACRGERTGMPNYLEPAPPVTVSDVHRPRGDRRPGRARSGPARRRAWAASTGSRIRDSTGSEVQDRFELRPLCARPCSALGSASCRFGDNANKSIRDSADETKQSPQGPRAAPSPRQSR